MNRENFWGNVVRSGADECWQWTRALLESGHGHAYYEGRHRTAHAIAWELANEASVLPGICVCHQCDNPPCCNPAHLFLGTKGDNSRDRHAKGRTARGDSHWSHTHPERVPRGDMHYVRRRPETIRRGERVGGSKLRDWQIRYIAALVAAGIPKRDAGRAYGVAGETIAYRLRELEAGR